MNEFISIGNWLFKISEIIYVHNSKDCIWVSFIDTEHPTACIRFESEEMAKAEFFKINQKLEHMITDKDFELRQKNVKEQIIKSIDKNTHPILMAIIDKADISKFSLFETWGIKGKRLHVNFFGPEGTIEYISERK